MKKEKKVLKGKPLFLNLSTRDKVNFARYLAVMLDAGIPLHEALGVLQEQATDQNLRYILNVAIADLADGMPLHVSIAAFPKVFDTFFVNALKVGESSGTLSPTLRYLALQLEKSDAIQGKVRSALVYPLIVFVGALGIAGYLAFFMLPTILPLFQTLNVELPATTRSLLFISTWLRLYWPWVLGVGAGACVVIPLLFRIRPVAYATSQFVLAVPVLSVLTQNLQAAKFSRILGTLLTSGVTIVEALRITADSTDNPVYRKEIQNIAQAVERGETIGAALRLKARLFSRTTASMVAVGERTGKLSDSLIALAEFTESEVDIATRDMSTLIEPITLLIVGLLVGFVALSIITPIYQITQGVHA